MFDDPNKSLKKLQEQLMAAEEPEEDIFAPAKPVRQEDAEEVPDSPAKKRTRTALLVAMLLLEVAALLMVLAWWLLWK